MRKTRVYTRRDQPLSEKIITKINSKSIQKSQGTTGAIESMQRSNKPVQRNLDRDHFKLELGKGSLEGLQSVLTLNKTTNFFFLINCKNIVFTPTNLSLTNLSNFHHGNFGC